MPHHCSRKDDPVIDRIIRAAIPNTAIKNVTIYPNKSTIDLTAGAYWQDGYRDYYYIVNVHTLQIFPAPETHPIFSNKTAPSSELLKQFPLKEIREYIVVVHKYMGVNQAIEIYTPGLPAFLPAPLALTPNERKVLQATKSYKSSYAGISDYRKHELMTTYNRSERMTSEKVDEARETLREKGMLDKRNSITNSGRNALNG